MAEQPSTTRRRYATGNTPVTWCLQTIFLFFSVSITRSRPLAVCGRGRCIGAHSWEIVHVGRFPCSLSRLVLFFSIINLLSLSLLLEILKRLLPCQLRNNIRRRWYHYRTCSFRIFEKRIYIKFIKSLLSRLVMPFGGWNSFCNFLSSKTW